MIKLGNAPLVSVRVIAAASGSVATIVLDSRPEPAYFWKEAMAVVMAGGSLITVTMKLNGPAEFYPSES